eukprot:GHVN01055629.1.p1 GENE.GHVN01055629.1~~GHVN01055629.1.p1  ORF type:complete len:218 (-),score=30.89 GHVN01055629.1:640-1293(-)
MTQQRVAMPSPSPAEFLDQDSKTSSPPAKQRAVPSFHLSTDLVGKETVSTQSHKGLDPPNGTPENPPEEWIGKSSGRHRTLPSIACIPEDRADIEMDAVLTPRGPVDAGLGSGDLSPCQQGAIAEGQEETEKRRFTLNLPQSQFRHPSSGNGGTGTDNSNLFSPPRAPWPMTERSGNLSATTEYGFQFGIFSACDDGVQNTAYDSAASKLYVCDHGV